MKYIISKRQAFLLTEQEEDDVFPERLRRAATMLLESLFEPFEIRKYEDGVNEDDEVIYTYCFVKDNKIIASFNSNDDDTLFLDGYIVKSLASAFSIPTQKSVKGKNQPIKIVDDYDLIEDFILDWLNEKYNIGVTSIYSITSPESRSYAYWDVLIADDNYEVVKI